MTTIAVVAHIGGTLGGGLEELREVLAAEGVTDPLWYEVSDIRAASERARRAREEGADLVFVWGGDGTVQRCVDGLADTGATIAIMPAGTGNLLAANLGIPADLHKAVEIGLHGAHRPLGTGLVNGEHFIVMAGAVVRRPHVAGRGPWAQRAYRPRRLPLVGGTEPQRTYRRC
jgi:diacylglycerol kinase (ATP)